MRAASTPPAASFVEKEASEIVTADSPGHADLGASLRRGDRLVAALAAEFRLPGEAGDGLSLARPVGRSDHDVVVQAADHHDDGARRRNHALRRLDVDGAHRGGEIALGGGKVAPRHGGEDGVEDDQLRDTGRGILAQQRRALCRRTENHVGDRGERRSRIVGQRDRARAASARQLQRLQHGGGRARMGKGDGHVALAEQRGRHQHHVRVVEDAGRARRCAGTCAPRRARSGRNRRCRRNRAGGRGRSCPPPVRRRRGSRIDKVSSSAWMDVRNTLRAISASVSSGESSWCRSAVGRRL